MITQKEYELLKEYRRLGFKWISRDKNKMMYVYNYKPFKGNGFWETIDDETSYSYILNSWRADIFKSITWEDEKPTKINGLIRDYESHQIITGENMLNDFFGTDNFNIKYVPQFKDLLSSLKDYESHKEITGGNNMNKAELIKEIEDILDDIGVSDYQLGECDEDTIWTISSITIRNILSAIEKYSPDSAKVTVPQFVADWIEEVKALERSFKIEILFDTDEMPDDVFDWLDERWDGDTDILAKAWLNGYVVEKEKLYTVQLKNGYHLCKYEGTGVRWLNMTEFNTADCYKLTQAEIESVDPRLMQFAVEVE